MCGIAGIWNRGGERPVDEAVLLCMSETLKHRGPDDAGHIVDGGFGMAHRRLAIIDLSSAGRQPMSTPDGRYTVSFNGEIYNYRELRKKYCSGVKLKSTSDTEILLHVLAKKGDRALSELRGMFALALWDSVERRLLLATDPFGKKPLYWAECGDVFLFASEIKALLEHPLLEEEMDRQALAKYFLYEYVPAPATGYEGIKQVPMGHYAWIDERGIKMRQWWRPDYLPKHTFATEQEAVEELDEKLARAVQRRMIADVPVGLLLSGGLDSTSIGWYMRQASTAPLHSFSVSFDEQSFDEGDYARLAARKLGTTHHDLRFGVSEFHEALAAVVPLMDMPFGDASLLPTWAISKLARSEITVALDGNGSDELLGGYGTFQAAEVAKWLPSFSPGIYGAVARLTNMLPTNLANFSLDFKIKSFVGGLGYSRAQRNQIWLGSFVGHELEQLLQPGWHQYIGHIMEDVDELAGESDRLETLDAVSLLKVNHYLQNDILVKLDRATMFVSLEARTPFLDVDLAEWLMKLPVRLKRNKYILRQLMRGRIPSEIIDRPKRGFGVPIGFWLKGPLYDWACSILSRDKLAEQGILSPDVVCRLLEQHKTGIADHRKKLWTLLTWQMWYDNWIK